MESKSDMMVYNNHQQSDCRFACNICLESPHDPVVTRCGHLYCWPCLYRWLEPGFTNSERMSLETRVSINDASNRNRLDIDYNGNDNSTINQSRRVCPVCKSETTVEDIIPIYVRAEPTRNQLPEEENGTDTCQSTSEEIQDCTESQSQDLDSDAAFHDDDDIDGSCSHHDVDSTTDDQIQNNSIGLRRRRVHPITDSTIHTNPVPSTEYVQLENPIHSSQEYTSMNEYSVRVPLRPLPPSPTRSESRINTTTTIPYNDSNNRISANTHNNVSPRSRSNSTQLLHQSLFQAFLIQHTQIQQQQQEQTHGGNRIPSIHLLDRNHTTTGRNTRSATTTGSSTSHYEGNGLSRNHLNGTNDTEIGDHDLIYDTDSTQFLSRLLLMLVSFVFLCFLLF